MLRRNPGVIPAIALIGLLTAIFAGWASLPYKLGVAPDSISYLSIAKHVAAGKGISIFMANESTVSKPITAWAPLYPFLLSGLDFMRWDLRQATWFFHLILLGLNVFLAGFLIYKFTQNNILAVVMAIFIALDPRTYEYQTWLLSEPVFILLLNLSLFFLWKNFETQKQSDLWWSAFFLGLSPLTRYIGAVFIPAACLSVFIGQTGSFLKRVQKTLIYGILSCLPLLLWSFRNWLLAQHNGSSLRKKTFGSLVHEGEIPVPFIENLKQSFIHIQNWIGEYLLHTKHMPVLGLMVFIILVGLTFLKINKKIASLLLFIFIYVIGLSAILRISLFSLPVPDRYVYPVYAFIFMLFLFFIDALILRTSRATKIILLLLLISWSALSAKDSLAWADRVRQTGIDESKGLRWAYVQRIPWFPLQVLEEPKILLGGFGLAEGPVVSKKGEVFFTDIKKNKILKWSKEKGLSVLLENTAGTNGLAFDTKNRLLMCEAATHRITYLKEDGKITVLSDQYQNLPLNSPNDICTLKNGYIYFTNPAWGTLKADQSLPGIYLITPSGETRLVFSQLLTPNGLEVSPDENKLYASDTARGLVVALDIERNGNLKNPAIVTRLESPDGICKDRNGNLLVAEFGAGRVQIISPYGRKLGSVDFPEKETTNCVRDPKDSNRYYVTAGNSIYTMKVET